MGMATNTKSEQQDRQTGRTTVEAFITDRNRHKAYADRAGMKMAPFHGLLLDLYESAPEELRTRAIQRFTSRRRRVPA